MASKTRWADVTDEYINIQQPNVILTDCCCLLSADIDDVLSLSEADQEIFKNCITSLSSYKHRVDYECNLNILVNAVSVASCLVTKGELPMSHKLLFCDKYFRFRHEFACDLFNSAIGMPYEESDKSFKEVFGIDSKRTPDFIFVNEKEVLIMEYTVTGDFDTAARRKGLGDKGYVSKYQEEIDILQLEGYNVDYEVAIIDTNDPNNNDYLFSLERAANFLDRNLDHHAINIIDLVALELSNVHRLMSRFFKGEMAVLLTYETEINYELKEKSRLGELLVERDYKPKFEYKRLTISSDIYNKFQLVWFRLSKMLANVGLGQHKHILLYDTLRSRFRFHKDLRGKYPKDILDSIQKADKISILNILYVQSRGQIKSCFENTHGLDFFIKQPSTNLVLPSFHTMKPYYKLHPNSQFMASGDSQSIDVVERHVNGYHSKFIDEDYEEVLIDSAAKFDLEQDWSSDNIVGLGLLAECKVDGVMKALGDYSESLLTANNTAISSTPMKEFWYKPAMLYPIADLNNNSHCNFKQKNITLLRALAEINIGGYTSTILSKCIDQKFELGSRSSEPLSVTHYELLEKKRVAESNYYTHAKEIAIQNKLGRVPKYQELLSLSSEAEYLNAQMKSETVAYQTYCSNMKVSGKTIPTIKLRLGSQNSFLKTQYMNELSHFKSREKTSLKRGFYSGDGDIKDWYKKSCDLVTNLLDYFCTPCLHPCQDQILHDHVSSDNDLLFKLKRDALNEHLPFNNKLMATNLAGVTEFISRFCHSLMYYSQTSFSAEHLMVDNLGYENTVLIVRGGKKIFRTKQSRMYRLIYPISEDAKQFYCSPTHRSNFRLVKIRGINYMITPWQMMHETLIADGISLHHRVLGYLTLCKFDPANSTSQTLIFNALLAIHGKRSTEEFMHNVRYFLVNNMGIYSNLSELLKGLVAENSDVFQFYLRMSITENFNAFHQSLTNLSKKTRNISVNHLFLPKTTLKTVEDLTYMIYSTFLMTKAPVNQVIEQVKNLKAMMSIHEEVLLQDREMCFKECHEGFGNYVKDLFGNDVNFDLKYCSILGRFGSDYLSSKQVKSDLLAEWENILSKGWQELANTKGLRTAPDEVDFFGQKGYYVMLKNTLSDSSYEKLLDLLARPTDLTPSDLKFINSCNQTYKEKLKNAPGDLSFHAVDKRQRGGSREIYVMDLLTKTHQQPLEKYFKKLCKLLPNEIISIPSARRLHTIHNKVFEQISEEEGAETVYLTLDCRKWAPKSMLEKYVVFMAGFSDILPNSFLRHFFRFFEAMFTKRIYTRRLVFDALTKSTQNAKYKQYFTCDEVKASFKMDYSFVMGIFNYLSSFMHAVSQLYNSYLIPKIIRRGRGGVLSLDMFCHSDDSAGKMSADSQETIRRGLFYYEVFMKAANQLLSTKKSVVSKSYFEFVSILYVDNVLLPLTPKFLGGIGFKPTDKGYPADALTAPALATELVLNGSTFDIAYLAQKIQSHLIWKFYFNTEPTRADYYRPAHLLGMPDPHPLLSMLCGSDADIIRLILEGSTSSLSNLLTCSDYFSLSTQEDDSFCPMLAAEPNVSLSKPFLKKKLRELLLKAGNFCNSWTATNVQFDNTMLDSISVLMKCRQKPFISAMQDESQTRRISRAYFFRSKPCIKTTQGYISFKQLRNIIETAYVLLVSPNTNHEKLLGLSSDILKDLLSCKPDDAKVLNLLTSLRLYHGEVIQFFEYISRIGNYGTELNFEPKLKTCKPVHLSIAKLPIPISKIQNPNGLISWIKEPDYRVLLPNIRGMSSQHIQLKNYLSSMGLSLEEMPIGYLQKVVMKANKNTLKDFYLYSNVPSTLRKITNLTELCMFLAHNCKKEHFLQGISVLYPDSQTKYGPSFSILMDTNEFRSTTAYLSLLFNALKYGPQCICTLFDLTMAVPDFLQTKTKVLNAGELLTQLADYWKLRLKSWGYFRVYFDLLQGVKNGSIIVDQSMKAYGDFKFLSECYFYLYDKKQKLVNNAWLGEASVVIKLPDLQLQIKFDNRGPKSWRYRGLKGAISGISIDYINNVLSDNHLQAIHNWLLPIPNNMPEDYIIGCDDYGLFQVAKPSNLTSYLPNSSYVFRFEVDYLFSGVTEVAFTKGSGLVLTIPGTSHYTQMTKAHFVSLDLTETENVINTWFIRDENNTKLLQDYCGPLPEHFKLYMYKLSGLDLYVDFDTFLNNVVNSRLYKIFKTAQDMNRLELPTEVRQTTGPCTPGGFLSIVSEASQRIPELQDFFNAEYSPDYMTMRTINPESYSSIVLTQANKIYNSIYSAEDKQELSTELNELIGIIEGKNDAASKAKLRSILREWGLVGTEGSLIEYSKAKKPEMFNYFVIRGHSPFKAIHLKGLFYNLLKSVTTVIQCNPSSAPEILRKISGYRGSLDFRGLQNAFNTFLLSIIGSHRFGMYTHVLDPISQRIFPAALAVLLDDVNMSEHLSTIFEDDPILCNLPISGSSIINWVCTVNGLLNATFQSKLNLNRSYLQQVPISETTSIRNVFDQSLSWGYELPASSVRFGGFFTTDLINLLKKPMRYYKNAVCYKTKPIFDKLSRQHYLLCKETETPLPLNEDALDTDAWSDLMLEFTSREPDYGNIPNYIQAIYDELGEDIYVSPTKTVGPDVTIKLHIVEAIGAWGFNIRTRIHQIGENVLVLTDCNIDIKNSTKFCTTCTLGPSWSMPKLDNSGIVALLYCNNELGKVLCDMYDLSPFNYPESGMCFANVDIGVVMKTTSDEAISYSPIFIKEEIDDESNKLNPEDDTVDVQCPELEALKEQLSSLGIPERFLSRLDTSSSRKNIVHDLLNNLNRLMRDSKTKHELVKGLTDEYMKTGMRSKEEVEDITQAPRRFRQAISRNRGKRNTALNDQFMRAELNSLKTGLSDRLFSGNLTIDSETLEEMKDTIELCTSYVLNQENAYNKEFILTLITSIVNDSYVVSEMDGEDESIWLHIRRNLKRVVLRGQRVKQKFKFDMPETGANMPYKLL